MERLYAKSMQRCAAQCIPISQMVPFHYDNPIVVMIGSLDEQKRITPF